MKIDPGCNMVSLLTLLEAAQLHFVLTEIFKWLLFQKNIKKIFRTNVVVINARMSCFASSVDKYEQTFVMLLK